MQHDLRELLPHDNQRPALASQPRCPRGAGLSATNGPDRVAGKGGELPPSPTDSRGSKAGVTAQDRCKRSRVRGVVILRGRRGRDGSGARLGMRPVSIVTVHWS